VNANHKPAIDELTAVGINNKAFGAKCDAELGLFNGSVSRCLDQSRQRATMASRTMTRNTP
jgi:hypothetical protein